MRLRTLSILLMTAVLAVGAVGCKKKMDRVTPLPGYGAGATIRDANHFTAIAPLADPNSPMTQRLKQLAGR